MKITRDFVIQNLADSGLMSADDASSLCESLSSLSGPADSDTVAQELSGTDKLTAYQAECVCRGETSGLLFGDYVVLEKIGQGGMGVVLKAQHTRMERIVAVKKLTAAALESEDLVKRFYREVKASARLLHPNVVTALDAREHEGVHYLIMEFIEGEDLSDVLKRQGPLPVDEAVDYVVQAAQGLEFAHKHGVYHRDIKPANLLLDHEGTVKILDMGLARIVSEAKGNEASRDQLTSDDQVMGTCDYMAPEQAENTKGVDHRADIYSLGCTLYRLLTNSAPYTGANLMQLLLAHRESPIPSICDKRPDVPASVDAVFQKMMAKTREQRYQSMTEVIEALQAALGRGPTPAAAPAPDPGLMDFLKQIHDEPSGVSRGGRGSGKTDAAQAAVTVQEKADPTTDETVDMSATADTDPSTSTRQPSTPAARPKKPATRRKKKQTAMLLMMGVGFGISLIGAAVVGAVLYVHTNYGTVVVSTHDEDVEVLVKRGGDVHVADAKNRWRIELQSGKYSVELKEGNDRFVLDKDTITVTRGDEVRVRVELKPRPKPPRPAIADRPSPNGLKFSGDGYVAFKTLRYTGASPITIEAYVTPINSKVEQILANVQFSGLGLNVTDGVWKFVFHDAVRYQVVVSDHKAKIGEMTHVAAVYDGRTLHLYVSGKVQQSVATTSGPHKSSRYPLMMGADPGNGGRPERFFRGIIHQLRVSKTARYTSDFQPDAQLQADSDTEALYRMDNDTGDTLKDLSGHQHHGTIHKAEWYRLAISPPATGRDGESPPTGGDPAAPSTVSLDDLPPWQLPPDAPQPAIAPFDAVQAKEHQEAWADYLKLPAERDFDLPGGEKLKMRLIPPGDFLMGSSADEQARFLEEAKAAKDHWAIARIPSEGPQHPVRITRPFLLGKYEVTQAQWELVMGNNPSKFKDNPSHPVEQVSWQDIQPFLEKLNAAGTLRLPSAKSTLAGQRLEFALPTEAQWEYACRAGTTTFWHDGDTEDCLRASGWYKANSDGKTHPVGQLKASVWGLYDMHGNVSEWCADWYGKDYYGQSPTNNPSGPPTGSRRVGRCGGWGSHAGDCRSAFRYDLAPDYRQSGLGLRLALVPASASGE